MTDGAQASGKQQQAQVMGILNATPDSFSDAGQLAAISVEESRGFRVSVDKALARAEAMQGQGAAIIDVGGESTRPGAEPVPVQEELDRVIPLVEAIASRLEVKVSVDTSTPEVIREAVRRGATLINDVRSLAREGALEAAVAADVDVCLMHMLGEPGTMQQEPRYHDVVREVYAFLEQRIEACVSAGLSREKLIIDPGFGFGKTLEHNYTLLRNLDYFQGLGCPILVGMSRKSMIGAIVDRPVAERVYGGICATVHAINRGAGIVRTHDVAATIDAIRVNSALWRSPAVSARAGQNARCISQPDGR